MGRPIDEFRERRQRGNELLLSSDNRGIKRFFALDERAYEPGALDAGTKELLGLAASMVLRCDDCITYHLTKCVEHGIEDDAIFEAMNIALVVGGSIVIPHARRAAEALRGIREG
jgi:AhpD family alkylhydroperoxidase